MNSFCYISLKFFNNRQTRFKHDQVSIHLHGAAILFPIAVNGFLQELFGNMQAVRQLMLIAAVLPVTMDDTGETDGAVISPESGMAFLFTVCRIRLIKDVTGAGVIVAKLFSQDTGFLRLRRQIFIDGNSIAVNPPVIAREIFFTDDKSFCISFF